MPEKKKTEGFTWKEVKTEAGHEPSKPIECSFCGSKMSLRLAAAVHSPTTGKYSNTLTYGCDNCGYIAAFSIPIDDKFYAKLVEKRGGTNYTPVEA